VQPFPPAPHDGHEAGLLEHVEMLWPPVFQTANSMRVPVAQAFHVVTVGLGNGETTERSEYLSLD
jgi:hypothetical protein